MTYGWAILIIAVVMGGLYTLGVFNPFFFVGKAPPGACTIFRPSGPNSTQLMQPEGECNGALPQFVTTLNGKYGYVFTGDTVYQAGASAITVSAWVYLSSVQTNGWFASLESSSGIQTISSSDIRMVAQNGCYADTSGYNLATGIWYHVVGTFNSGTYNIYVDGVRQTTIPAGSCTTLANNGNTLLGAGTESGSAIYGYTNGFLANVQIYNSSLSSNDVSALYTEGIGGVPINLQHLVAWWPLNGNTNDYSGDNLNGVANSISYTSSWWTSGYSVP